MASGHPEPTTKFLAWGQAAYRIYDPSNQHGKFRVLFAISETDRKYLGWYYFDGGAVDHILMQAPKQVDYTIWAEKSGEPIPHFSTKSPMTVEDLIGRFIAARGGSPSKILAAPATLKFLQPSFERFVNFDLQIGGQSPVQFHLTLQRTKEISVNTKGRTEQGAVSFIMAEPFSYPVRHLNVRQRLKTFEHNLTRP